MIILTAIIGSFMLSSGSMGETLLRASATLKGYESLYPWTNVNHMLLIDTHKWLLVSFQCKFLSIQEVVELFHSSFGSKCLPFQILIILFSFGQSSGNITNHFPLLDYICTCPFLEASICRVVSALMSKYGRALMLETSIFILLKFSKCTLLGL